MHALATSWSLIDPEVHGADGDVEGLVVGQCLALAEPDSTLLPHAISQDILGALPIFVHAGNGNEIAVNLHDKLLPTIARVEGEMIKAALRTHHGKVDAVAKALGISRELLGGHGLRRPEIIWVADEDGQVRSSDGVENSMAQYEVSSSSRRVAKSRRRSSSSEAPPEIPWVRRNAKTAPTWRNFNHR